MTSKRSFINIQIEDLRRRLWPIALSLVGFFFALPVLALIKLEDHMNSLVQGWDTLTSLQQSFVLYALGPNNEVAIAGLMIMASLNAIQGMKYLHSRQEADFYGAIPVLRTQKFAAAFLNGILIGVIPYIIMQLAAAAIGASRGFVTGEGFLFAMQTMLLEIIGFLLVYAVIVLAAILTGHNAVTVAGAAVLSFGLLAYAILFEGYKSMYFMSMYQSNTNYVYRLSPFTVFFQIMWVPDGARSLAPYSYHINNVISGAICFLIALAVFLISLKLITIRPAEAAGRSMAFEKTKPFIKVFIMIPVILACGAFFPSLTDKSKAYGWLVFGIIVGIILAHAVIEIIYEFDFKACTRNFRSGAVGAAISVAIIAFFVFDLTGYDTKLPSKDKVASAAVYIPGIESGMYSRAYYSADYDPMYGITDSDLIMRDMMLTDTDDVYTLAQAGCDYAKKYRMSGSGPAGDGSADENKHYIQISVTMRKPSGADFKRTYYVDRDDSDIMTALSRIYSTDEFKNNAYEILAEYDNMKTGNLDYIQYETADSTETASDVSDADTDRLLSAMAEETRALTLEDLKQAAPVGYLEFELKPEMSSVNSSWSRPVGYVYPSFTKTLSILKETGMETHDTMNPEEIDFIVNIKYDEEGNDISERIEGKDAITSLIPDLVPQNYASTNYAFFDVDYNSTYEVHFRSTQPGEAYDASNIGFYVKRSQD